jgi:hypothetical protein
MPVASIELSSTHFHNYLFIFVLKCVVEMALYKYLTKEKDKLVEGEEFVKANELVEVFSINLAFHQIFIF